MVRRVLGHLIEWALGYERIVDVDGTGELPYKCHRGDAGYDLVTSRYTLLSPNGVTEVSTGIYMSARSRVWFEIKARSSTFKKLGLEVQDAVIDNGYRGELFAIVYNPGPWPVGIDKDTRICQIVPHLLLPCRFRYGELRKSDRGTNGFGSTGS